MVAVILIINYIALAFSMYSIPKLLNKNKKVVFLLNLFVNLIEIVLIILFSYQIYRNEAIKFYDIVYIAVPLLLIYYTIYYDRVYLSKTISIFSVYDGVNKLEDGLMFFKNGHAVFSNESMDTLISSLFKYKIKNENYLFLKLKEIEATDIKFNDFLCVRLNDRIYAFSKRYIGERLNNYVEVNSTDVTEEINIINELKVVYQRLNEINDSLNEYLENIEILESEKQRNFIMNKIHNSLSYRISILNREIISKSKYENNVYEQLININKEFNDSNVLIDNKIELLNEDLEPTGAKVFVSGFCPLQLSQDELIFEIIREATTNAIFHGEADKIFVTFYSNKLEITNNGKTEINFKKGKGITLLEKRCNERGWYLDIENGIIFKMIVKYGELL